MKITIYSMKGGVGKTPIAVNIALERGYALATNEPFNILEHIIPEDQLLTTAPEFPFPDFGRIDVVFDLAGMMAKGAKASIVSALRQSDVVVVPVSNEIKSLNAAVHTIAEIEPFNANIIIAATKLERQRGDKKSAGIAKTDPFYYSKDYLTIRNYIAARLPGSEFMIYPLKLSKAYDAMFKADTSIAEMMKASPLRRHNYKAVAAQFKTLMEGIDLAARKEAHA